MGRHPLARGVTRAGVAVVGASAAGLAAAVAAAEAGADVLLLEARDEVGVPPAPAVVAFDFLWPRALPLPAGPVRRRLRGARVASPGGRALDVDAPLSILDRTVLDRALAERARRAGARVVTGVRGLRVGADRVLAWEGGEARAGVVVFADGALSLGRALLPTLRDPERLAWGAALAVEGPDAEREERLRIFLGAHARGGRSQANPLGGASWSHWTFYLGGTAGAGDAEGRARRALAHDARLLGWPDDAVKGARFVGAAPDPVYALPGRIAGDGVLAAGGAAGQGGVEMGVAAGLLAGEVAARAVAHGRTDAAALREYERAWRRRHLTGYRMLRAATDALARLDDAELDDLLAPWDGRAVRVGDAGPARALMAALAANPRALGAAAVAAARALR